MRSRQAPKPERGDVFDQRLLDAKETAALLHISKRTLWTLTNRGDVRHLRIGRAVRYDPVDLRAWIQKEKAKCARR